MEYTLDHHGDHFWIVTNDNAINFKLVKAPIANPGKDNWVEIIPHRYIYLIDDLYLIKLQIFKNHFLFNNREGVKVDDVMAFKNYFVVEERENGLKQFRVIPVDNTEG